MWIVNSYTLKDSLYIETGHEVHGVEEIFNSSWPGEG